MSTLKINVILYGIGNVESTLINQVIESQKFFLEKRNIDLRFPIITNSTLAFFEKEGVKNQWEANFAQSAIPFRIEDIIEYVQEQNQYINFTQEAMSMAMEFAIEKLGINYSDFGLPEDEYEECLLKAKAMMQVLGQ